LGNMSGDISKIFLKIAKNNRTNGKGATTDLLINEGVGLFLQNLPWSDSYGIRFVSEAYMARVLAKLGDIDQKEVKSFLDSFRGQELDFGEAYVFFERNQNNTFSVGYNGCAN